jgi:hypothetical protein
MTRTNPAVSTWKRTVLVNEVAANFESWDAHKKKIEFHVGPIGFSLATSANCRT